MRERDEHRFLRDEGEIFVGRRVEIRIEVDGRERFTVLPQIRTESAAPRALRVEPGELIGLARVLRPLGDFPAEPVEPRRIAFPIDGEAA